MTEESITRQNNPDMPTAENNDLKRELQKLKKNAFLYPFMIFIAAFSLWGIALDSSSRTFLVWAWGILATLGLILSFFELRAGTRKIEKAVTEQLNISPDE